MNIMNIINVYILIVMYIVNIINFMNMISIMNIISNINIRILLHFKYYEHNCMVAHGWCCFCPCLSNGRMLHGYVSHWD